MAKKKTNNNATENILLGYAKNYGSNASGGNTFNSQYQTAQARQRQTAESSLLRFAADYKANGFKFPSDSQQSVRQTYKPTYMPTNQQAPSYTQNPLIQAAQNKVNNGYVTGSATGDKQYQRYLQQMEQQIKNSAYRQNLNDPQARAKEKEIEDIKNQLMSLGKSGATDIGEYTRINNQLAEKQRELSTIRSGLSSELPNFSAKQAYFDSMSDDTLKQYQENLRQKREQAQNNLIDASTGTIDWMARQKYMQDVANADQEGQYVKNMLDQRNWNSKYQEYMNLRNDANFDGSYQSTYKDNGQYVDPRGNLNGAGEYIQTEMGKYGDIAYDYLNNDPNAEQVMHTMNPYGFRTGNGAMNSYYARLTDEEKEVFNHLYKQSPDKAYEFMDFMADELEKRERQENEKAASEFATENPVAASMLSVSTALGSPIAVASDLASAVKTGDFDTDTWANQFSYIPTAIRQTVSNNIAANSPFGQAGVFLYNTGMSMADNMAQMFMTGGMSQASVLALMGTQVFSNAVTEGVAEGKTTDEILLDAFIQSGVEVLTEKIGLDEVFEYMGGTRTFAQLLKSAGAEGSEEALADILNWGMDGVRQVTMGRESEMQEKYNAYRLQGFSQSEALAKVVSDMAKEAGTDALGGALSGFGLAGGGAAITDVANGYQFSKLGQEIKDNLPETSQYRKMKNRKLGEYFANVQQTMNESEAEETSPSAATEEIPAETANESPKEENVSNPQSEFRNQQIMAPLRIYSEAQMAQESERNYIDNIAKERFGKSGFEAYRSAVQNNNALDSNSRMEVLGDFTKAYNAGMNNQVLPSDLRISEQSAKVAYETGKNAVLDQYRDENGKFKKGFTSYYSNNDGLVVDQDMVQQAVAEGRISQKDMDGFADLGVRLGTKIYLKETMPQNGWYENGGIAVALDADNGMKHVLSHEFVHRLQEAAPEEYEKLKNYIADYIGSEELEKALSGYYNLGKSQGINISQTVAMDEVVADFVAGHVVSGDLEWKGFVERTSQTQEGRTFLQKIRDFFRSIVNKLRGSKNPEVIRLSESLVKAQKLLDDTLNAAQRNVENGSKAAVSEEFKRVLESHGAYAGDNSVAKYSLRSWNETDIDALRNALQDAGYDLKEINKWIKDVNGIAATITADKTRLDYEADEYQSALKPNAEYYYTLDLSTLCKKRLLYQGTYNAIMHRLVNKALMPEDTITLRRMMDDMGYEVPCGICYEESRKKNEGKFAERWLEGYESWKGYRNQKHSDPYIPTLDQVTTTDGRAWLQKNHPEAYDSYIEYQKGRGSANPKVSFTHTDYRGDILRMTKSDIANVTHIGGLRIQSFSDFETVHVIDMMQAVMDMASKNLTAQAYTKVPAFADIFGGTGIKINLSLIGKAVNGKLVFDAKEGIDPKEAFRIRKKYSENVGTIIVGANDESILAAWADPRIDMVIPFHRSGWSGAEFEKLGLKDYQDYTEQQTEVYIFDDGTTMSLDKASKKLGLRGDQKLEGIYSEDYWDYGKTGKENAEAYLKLCAEKNYRPVFYKFLTDNGDGTWSLPKDGSADGYWKSLTDFKMYNNEGVGAPQQEVKPNFDMRVANKTMREYDGNPNTLPVAQDVVDKFVKEYKNGKRYSLRESDGYNIDGATARWTDERIDSLIREYGASNPNYSQAYAALINPRDYLKLTLSDKMLDRWNEGSNMQEHPEVYSLDEERLRENTQTPFLSIYSNDGTEIQGHEGRHRMRALLEAGVTSVPVVIKDTDTKYSKQTLDSMTLYSQDFGEGPVNNGATVTVNNLVPIKESNRDELVRMFGGEADVRFSLRDSEYLDLAKDPTANSERLQEMVEQAAKDAGFTVRAYHGTPFGGFTVFNTERRHAGRAFGDGIYLTSSKEVADEYTAVRARDFDRIDAGEVPNYTIYDAYVKVADDALEFDLDNFTYKGRKMGPVGSFAMAKSEAMENPDKDIVIHNIQDGSEIYSTVYVIKDSSRIKSADLVTYDNDGNVVPLSKRFDTSEQDIRFSLRKDSTGRSLSQGQDEYFKNSKVVDENGSLRVVYHGTSEVFNTFDASKGRANMDIQGMFFSPWEIDAGGYGENVRAYYLNITNPAPENVGYQALKRFQGQNNAGIKAKEFLESQGYDGVNNGDEEYIAFYSDQIKLIDNINPTHNPDIRYSLRHDSEGRELSEGQNEYFKDSKARYEDGSLMVLYHTTNSGGFTVFDPKYSDDKRSLFFASNFDVSQTYGTHARIPIKFEEKNYSSIEDFWKDFWKSYGASHPPYGSNIVSELKVRVYKIENGMYNIAYNLGNTAQERFDAWNNMSDEEASEYVVDMQRPRGSGRFEATSKADLLSKLSEDMQESSKSSQRGFYECYLNLTNPLIIDAMESYWNNIMVAQSGYEDEIASARDKIREDAAVAIKYLDADPFYNDDNDYIDHIELEVNAEIKNEKGVWEPIKINKSIESQRSLDDPEREDDLWFKVEEELLNGGLSPRIVDDIFEYHEHAMTGGLNVSSFDGGVFGALYIDEYGNELEEDEYYTGEGDVEHLTTRDISERAKKEGYDGAIIKNLVDIGGSSKFRGDNKLSDIVIAFDSNQVKVVDNLNPTDSPDIRFSLRQSGEQQPGIKEQVSNHLTELAEMNSVMEIDLDSADYDNVSTARKIAVNAARKIGFKIDRQGFGEIEYSESAIRDSFKYANTVIEKAAYIAVPKVLKQGIEIGQHNNHKGRGLDTITFAAPVTIMSGNETVEANMAVVVKARNHNTYKVHRVVPLESETIGQKNKTPTIPKESQRGVPGTRSLANGISALSADNISSAGENGKQNSLRGSRNVIEAAERDASIRNEYMEAADTWRNNMTALNEIGRSGFNTNMTALVRGYNTTIDKDTSEKIVGEIRSLAKEMVSNKDMTYPEVTEKANKIAAKILWGESNSNNFPTRGLIVSDDTVRAIDDIRNDIMAQILNSTTRGEGKYQRLAKEFSDYRERANDRISEVRRKRDAKLDEIKQQRADERARRSESADRTKLLKLMNRLNNISKKSTDANKALIQELIGDYSLVAKSITQGKADSLAELSKYIQDQMSVDPDFMPTERTIKDLARISQKNIADLSIDEVRMLNEALLNLEHEIRTNKRLIDSNYKQHISELGNEIIEGVQNTKGIGNSKIGVFNWFQQTYDKTLATPVIRPETEILRIIGFDRNNPLYQLTYGDTGSLASGQRDMVRYQWLANKRYADKFVNDRAFAETIMGKKARACEITGRRADGTVVTLKVTPDMLMALYMHAQNNHNFRHFGEWNDENGTQHGGGVTIPDFELYRKGKIQEAYRVGTRDGNLITMTRSSLNKAFQQLTEKEMSFIRAAQAYYSEMSQPEINRVSNLLLGYSIAQEENYFRINTDSNYRGTNMDAIKFDGTIEGMGFTKERIEGARNPILLIPLTEQFARDIDAHSKYIGMAIPVRNFNKAYGINRQSYNENGEFTGTETSVQSAITGKWGSGATEYIQKLMSDIQNPRTTAEGWNKIFGKLRSYYAGSVLALNAGVAIKQAASYPTAAAEIGWKPLIKAFGNTRLSGKMDMDIVNKYSPLMYLRTQGMGFQEIADLKNLNKGWLNRALNSKALNWIQDIDVMTIKKLWKASEYYVRDNFKDLKVGSEEYYRKVGEIHSKVIEHTQPNYTTLQRGEILRSDSDMTRTILGMFKTQPFQNFSVLFEATGELQAACRAYKVSPNSVTEAMRNAAVKKMARAITSQIVSSLVFSIMAAAWDWIRGRDDKYKDKDGRLTFASVFKQITINMGSNAFGMIPMGSVIYELVETTVDTVAKSNGGDAIFNATAYGLDASTATGIVNDIVDAIETLTKNVSSSNLDSKNTTEQHIRGYVDVLATVAQAFGYPADNFVKDGQAIAVNVFRTLGATGQMNKYEQEYYSKRIFTAVSKDKNGYLEILYNAYDNDRDAYNKLYSIYIENDGFATSSSTSKEYIDDKMNSYIKKRTKEDNRQKVGLTEDTMNEYQEALVKYDADHNGKYKQEEVYNALMSIALTQKQRETLWSENTSWKTTFSEYASDRK